MKSTNYLMEPLLTQFFLIDAVCRGFIDEAQQRTLFQELARVFCVPMDGEAEQYYALANAEQYKTITDYAAYERLCRTIEFAESSGQNVQMTAADRVVLSQKREAMLIKQELFKQSKNLTAELIADTLLNTAMNGNVDAMATLSYMEYHGICICRDEENAVRRLSLCAKWNNLFGNLMGIAYDPENQDAYYNTLYTILRSSNQREVFKYICAATGYDKPCTKSSVAKIIEKAFGLGIIQRNTYDRIFAKVAFSTLLSAEDKEKLLLNKKQGAIDALSDLPFDATREKQFSFDRKLAQNLPLRREAELDKLLCSLSPATNNRLSLYQTLLVAGDDAYVADMYVDALKAGFADGNKVIEVDAGTLGMEDFVGAKENFLLRGLSETKQSHTVFLVKDCEELGERELEELIKLLDYEYRCKFKLLEPTVCLDLSDVLIVLFASETNETVRTLARECDVVWTARISEEEKQTVIDATFRERARCFGVGRAELEDAGKAYLAGFKTEQIMRIIDGALKKAAYENDSVVTAETLKTISGQQNIPGTRRGFGYMGGVGNEQY
ncbi:MAG: hypothetical protein E7447_03385 [Ruminococcaceae bacterium]|nr:hypothetical protein [Oscillospiraceae bacterium]